MLLNALRIYLHQRAWYLCKDPAFIPSRFLHRLAAAGIS